MRIKALHTFLAVACLLLGLFSCGNKKALTGSTTSKMNVKMLSKNLEANQFNFDWFEGKMKVNYKDQKQKQSFSANLRMKKDEVIWLSLTGFLGIEGGRVLITPDSVFVIDRLNKRYLKEPISYVQSFLPVEADISTLQNILVGNYLGEPVSKQSLNINETTYSYQSDIKGYPAVIEVLAGVFKYKVVSIQSSELNGIINFKYDQYFEQENKQQFAMRRNIAFQQEGKTYNLQLTFSKIDINEEQSFPFSINPKYAKMQF